MFGASSHQYRIGKPASEREVREFEERFSLALPACYRAFLTGVGNGGQSYERSAAGPHYGIYPLGHHVDELVERPELFLSQPAVMQPVMSDEEWADQLKRLDNEAKVPEPEHEEEVGRFYAGILPIGSQGCSFLHVLVLNGPHAGRVVNLDLDGNKPKFSFETNFLDWHERWLDETISGELSRQQPSFGYTMGGDDAHLMRVYACAEDLQTRFDAVEGLTRLETASEATCQTLLGLCDDPDPGLRQLALRMLAKFDYTMASGPLRARIMGDDDDCLAACEGIRRYAEGKSREWADLLKSRLPKVNSQETFRFICYLLDSSGVDYGDDLRPFCTHPDENIRTITFRSLEKLVTKQQWVDLFLIGLDDASPKVVHATIQALKGVRDQRLAGAYVRVRERFKTDEHYILTNLKYREQEMGGGLFGGLRKRFGK